jgi:hypothetical protein
MPVWGWIVIGLAVAALLVALVLRQLVARRRSQGLQQRFGPEYEHTVGQAPSRREAEAELAERERRRERLDIVPLDPDARERYARSWRQVQADFVDSPRTAVDQADALVVEVMRVRGYPMDDFEQRAADVSVDHPGVVGHYREGHRLSQLGAQGRASTEDLRQAMRHYRELFQELLESSDGGPSPADREAVTTNGRALR